MLVAKNELNNALRLIKIRLQSARRGNLQKLLITVSIVFLANFIPAVISLFQECEGVEALMWNDYSIWFAVAMLIAIVISSITYRDTNSNFAVFPQTNTSRFLSNQMLYYFWIAFAALIAVVFYLVQYGAAALVGVWRPGIHFIYKFNPVFMLASLAVTLAYSCLAVGLITLIATLIRKFRLSAIVFFVALAALIIANMRTAFWAFKAAFGFLIYENSVWIFLLKSLLLCAAMFVASLIINKRTLYYRNAMQFSKRVAAGITVSAALLLTLLIIGNILFAVPISELEAAEASDRPQEESFSSELETIELDASALPRGSKIDVVVNEKIVFISDPEQITQTGYSEDEYYLEYKNGHSFTYPSSYLLCENNAELQSLSGDKIFIDYYKPSFQSGKDELAKLMNPKFNARLEGTTLYLDYTYQSNVKAIYFPTWSPMGQFDYFKGKGLFNEESDHISYSNNASAYIRD